MVDYHATADFLRSDSDQGMPIAARPSFKIDRPEPLEFLRILNAPSVASDEDTPSFAHRLINAIDLEANQLTVYLGGL
jgi:hypothetical protein